MPNALTNLLGMNKQALEAFLLTIGEKPFRAVQLQKWMHQQGETDFAAMTNIQAAAGQTAGSCGNPSTAYP